MTHYFVIAVAVVLLLRFHFQSFRSSFSLTFPGFLEGPPHVIPVVSDAKLLQ